METIKQGNTHSKIFDEFITINDAAQYLGVTKQRVTQLAVSGRIKSVKFDHARFLYKNSVEDYKNTRKIGRPKNDAQRN